ncbi:MAG: hypothetical protein R2825_22975 [Saprospiraceae bacterium]
MTEANFGMAHLDEGFITASWFRVMKAGAAMDAPLFSLRFRAIEGGMLSEMLDLNSRLTKAESYEADGTTHPVGLAFSGKKALANSFQLFQNIPNPFNDETIIGFQLPEAANAFLSVYDVSGKVMKTVGGQFAKGYHEIRIDNADLPKYWRFLLPS